MKVLVIIGVLVVLAGGVWGVSRYNEYRHDQAIVEVNVSLRPRCDEIIRNLNEMFAKLPPKGAPAPTLPGLAGRPIPGYEPYAAERSNTEFVEEKQWDPINVDGYWVRSDFVSAYSDIRSDYASSAQPPAVYRKYLEGKIDFRYWVLVQTLEHQEAVKSGSSAFSPGSARVRATLFDMTTKEPLVSIEATGRTSAEVKYTSYQNRKTGARRDTSDSALRSDLRQNVRAALKEQLEKATGGRFKL